MRAQAADPADEVIVEALVQVVTRLRDAGRLDLVGLKADVDRVTGLKTIVDQIGDVFYVMRIPA